MTFWTAVTCQSSEQVTSVPVLLLTTTLPSNAGARGLAWVPGAKQLTVKSLSVPPRWFSMHVYTVEPGNKDPDVTSTEAHSSSKPGGPHHMRSPS